jgi:secreted trypsin-like serine protease
LESFNGSKVEAAGWGTTEFGGPRSNTLQKVELDVISNAVCANQTENINSMSVCTQTPGKVSAYLPMEMTMTNYLFVPQDTCQSDSGGALFYTNPSNKYELNV